VTKYKLSRRGMLGALGGATLAACTVGVGDTLAVEPNTTWEARAKQLEDSSRTVYTATNEGPWTGKAGTHVPVVVANADGTVTASCTHGMTDADTAATPPVAQHYITTMYARDVDTGHVLDLVEFVTRGPAKATAAAITFNVPDGVTTIAVYAHCNEHDLWRSAPTAV
jgi:desulfoferrodoxin (superoxide reductase-like protein)